MDAKKQLYRNYTLYLWWFTYWKWRFSAAPCQDLLGNELRDEVMELLDRYLAFGRRWFIDVYGVARKGPCACWCFRVGWGGLKTFIRTSTHKSCYATIRFHTFQSSCLSKTAAVWRKTLKGKVLNRSGELCAWIEKTRRRMARERRGSKLLRWIQYTFSYQYSEMIMLCEWDKMIEREWKR